jgi:hypothetical protein
LGVLILLLLFIIKKATNFLIKNKNSKDMDNLEQNQSVLVKCSKCGARVPRENAKKEGKQIFYCKDHSDEQG